MSTAAKPTRTDLETICQAVADGKRLDPDLVKRVKERSDALRRSASGNLAVETLRAIREE